MEYFKQLFKNLSGSARAMSPSQAMLLIAIVAGFIVGGVVVANWVKSVNYAVLYSNLEPAEAGDVVNQLTEQNVTYKLSDNGTTIMVPAGDVYKVRINLASQGLPKSGNVGYAIFDKSNLGMTEFLQNLNFRRALEGELMKTIMQLSGVEAARVHIVMPKDRLFKEDQKEATASVVLKLRHNGGLAKSQLAGITHLVSSSVEGLKPENISILDYDGNLLSSATASDPLAGLSSSQLEVRQNVEQYLERKAQSMLDGVIGSGKSVVRVTAELDFQQVEKTNELYDPNSAVIRSQETTNSTKTATDKQEQAAETRDDNKTETAVTNYEINKTVEHIINSIGNIKRLSIAVLLDGVHKKGSGGVGAEAQEVYEPRPQEEIDRITAIIKNSVGYDTQRNDQIEVVNLPFDRTSIEFEQEKLDKIVQQEFYVDIGKKVLLILGALLILLYLRKKLKKFFTSLGRIMPAPPQRPASSGLSAYQMPGESEEDLPPIVPENRKPKLVDQMQVAAKGRPEEIAKVIKTMMIE
ncbi:Flagellar M-ring protein [Candidatus Zixiibacteriota bacterium]|nr:Flagellar M-ring protein [candidate division Zixibacteria bacterium]